MTDHGARAHAKYAPSAAYRWMKCHGSISASHGLDEGPSTSYAEMGTECHEAANKVLEGEPWHLATDGLDDDQLDIVEAYVDFCVAIEDRFIERRIDYTVSIESNATAHGISPHFSGTNDWRIVGGRTMRIVDLKAGKYPVRIRNAKGELNLQLASYLVLALADMGAPVSPWHFDPRAVGIDEMKITVVQPRVYEVPQTTLVEIPELREFVGAVSAAIDAIEGGDETRVAGEWCNFCPAKGICPELRKRAVDAARLDFEPVNNAPFEEWAAIHAEAELIAAHVKGIRDKIHRALERGMRIPGYKLVTGRAMKKWTNWEKLEPLLLSLYGADEVWNKKPKSPAAIMKLLKRKKDDFDVSPYFEVKPAGTSIAREDDPRDAIAVDPGADFEES